MADRENDKRFELRVSVAFLASLDKWRRAHPDLPSRAEAIRLLTALGIKAK